MFCVAVHGCLRNALQIADKTCYANFWMLYFFHTSLKFQNSFHIIEVKSLFINSVSQILNINFVGYLRAVNVRGAEKLSSLPFPVKWNGRQMQPAQAFHYYSSDESCGPSTTTKWANRRQTEGNRFRKEQILYFTFYHFL